MHQDELWMSEALDEAMQAFREGEVPIGSIVVCDGRIVGKGHNRMEAAGDPLAHAELLALGEAIRTIGRRALTQCVLYVTVEPCTMCVGAMLNSRILRVVFGAPEPKTGACGSILSIPNEPRLEHRMAVFGGVSADRCQGLIQKFFREKRQDKS
jgi:tRNA(adenine34) deaminase